MDLLDLAEEKDDVLRPYDQLDVLLLYGIVAKRLTNFLGDREVASRIWLPSGNIPQLLKRGSKMEPLTAEEISRAITPDFLRVRKEKEKLSEAQDLTEVQRKAWRYFVPRKYSNFFYATNHEGEGHSIDMLFFDLDRGANISAEQAREATSLFVDAVKNDDQFGEYGFSEPFTYWTGNSFHVLIFAEDAKPHSFYEEHIRYTQSDPESSFTGRWASIVDEQIDFEVKGGHEKLESQLNVDPSQTPSGKLCRVPLGSLHMEDSKTVDGVSIPLTTSMLGQQGITEALSSYGPTDIVENLSEFHQRLPEELR